jgi:hypothetical protein
LEPSESITIPKVKSCLTEPNFESLLDICVTLSLNNNQLWKNDFISVTRLDRDVSCLLFVFLALQPIVVVFSQPSSGL